MTARLRAGVRLTKSQLSILLAASSSSFPSVPYRAWPDFRDYERLVRMGLMRLEYESREFCAFRITGAGRVRVGLALSGSRTKQHARAAKKARP